MDARYFLDYFETNKQRLFEEYFEFLRFPTISANPDFAEQTRACAQWLVRHLQALGFNTQLWETSGNPIVYGEWLKAGKDKPTVLLYNHYDVQPVDPLHLWTSEPFEPEIREERVYARGAEDNKGQCFYVLAALKALLERDGSFPVNIKYCIEGEEEIGSGSLRNELPEKAETLKADHLLIVDVGLQKAGQGAITLGCRGITGLEVTVVGPNRDLHSGEHGGIVKNPIHVLVELLAKMRNEAGEITIPGFYDDVLSLTNEEQKQISFDFDPAKYEKEFGAAPLGGEEKFSALERAWVRPTVEVNGIVGGYTGTGSKTIVPSCASAKITCRLAPKQDPEKIKSLVAEFLRQSAPAGVKVYVDTNFHGGYAVRTSSDDRASRAIAKSYEEVLSSRCEFILTGGAIPIATDLSKASGAAPVLFGFGLSEDNIHSPNENFPVEQLKQGLATVGVALIELGRM